MNDDDEHYVYATALCGRDSAWSGQQGDREPPTEPARECLALAGHGTSGPVGVKNIAAHLNQRRIFTRDGGRWASARFTAS